MDELLGFARWLGLPLAAYVEHSVAVKMVLHCYYLSYCVAAGHR